jgi:hypothetical protein
MHGASNSNAWYRAMVSAGLPMVRWYLPENGRIALTECWPVDLADLIDETLSELP